MRLQRSSCLSTPKLRHKKMSFRMLNVITSSFNPIKHLCKILSELLYEQLSNGKKSNQFILDDDGGHKVFLRYHVHNNGTAGRTTRRRNIFIEYCFLRFNLLRQLDIYLFHL